MHWRRKRRAGRLKLPVKNKEGKSMRPSPSHPLRQFKDKNHLILPSIKKISKIALSFYTICTVCHTKLHLRTSNTQKNFQRGHTPSPGRWSEPTFSPPHPPPPAKKSFLSLCAYVVISIWIRISSVHVRLFFIKWQYFPYWLQGDTGLS